MSWLSRILRCNTRGRLGTDLSTAPCLDALKRLDRKLTVFGASAHRYRARRVSEAELAELERWCGIAMPNAFRRHLAEIGYGAGPYYGLWDPSTIRQELDLLYGEYSAESGARPSPARPFPLSRVDAAKIEDRRSAGDNEPWIASTWPIDGCIPICHQGCTYWTVLVLSGECAGCVWNVANYEGREGLWLPSHRPTGCLLNREQLKTLPHLPSPPTFEDWFWGWVEQATTDLSSQ